MRETRITTPELALIAGTRAALGIGIGLLLANRLTDQERRGVGWTLFLVGALTTIPLAIDIFGRPRTLRLSLEMEHREAGSRPDSRMPHRQADEMALR
jgi:hypothetical protein